MRSLSILKDYKRFFKKDYKRELFSSNTHQIIPNSAIQDMADCSNLPPPKASQWAYLAREVSLDSLRAGARSVKGRCASALDLTHARPLSLRRYTRMKTKNFPRCIVLLILGFACSLCGAIAPRPMPQPRMKFISSGRNRKVTFYSCQVRSAEHDFAL